MRQSRRNKFQSHIEPRDRSSSDLEESDTYSQFGDYQEWCDDVDSIELEEGEIPDLYNDSSDTFSDQDLQQDDFIRDDSSEKNQYKSKTSIESALREESTSTLVTPPIQRQDLARIAKSHNIGNNSKESTQVDNNLQATNVNTSIESSESDSKTE